MMPISMLTYKYVLCIAYISFADFGKYQNHNDYEFCLLMTRESRNLIGLKYAHTMYQNPAHDVPSYTYIIFTL